MKRQVDRDREISEKSDKDVVNLAVTVGIILFVTAVLPMLFR